RLDKSINHIVNQNIRKIVNYLKIDGEIKNISTKSSLLINQKDYIENILADQSSQVLLISNLEDRCIYAIKGNQAQINDDCAFAINMDQYQLQKSFLELLFLPFYRKVKKKQITLTLAKDLAKIQNAN
ncbi:hypothetical protein TTHERM_002653520, partial (macronuclear) [Tetrahymena thermophila SB210]